MGAASRFRDPREGTLALNRGIGGPVLIAEDDCMTLALIELSLDAAGYETCAAGSGADAMAILAETPVCAAVLDVNLPGRSGYEICREVRRLYGGSAPVLLVSGERTEGFDRVAGLLIGADDYLVKPFDPSELVARLDGLMRRSQAGASRSLTPREREVLRLLADGLDQLEIAASLGISSRTVATHIERILGKLGVRSRAQAVALAFRETLVAV